MKILKKADVSKCNQDVKAERDILDEADSEWAVNLYYSIQVRDSLYFVICYYKPGMVSQMFKLKFSTFTQ